MQPTGLHEHLAHVSWDVGCFMAFLFLFNRDQVEELKQEIPLIEKFIIIKKIIDYIFMFNKNNTISSKLFIAVVTLALPTFLPRFIFELGSRLRYLFCSLP
jgi:hypothetical protein